MKWMKKMDDNSVQLMKKWMKKWMKKFVWQMEVKIGCTVDG